MTMQGPRVERVAKELQHEIAKILQGEIKDPRLGFVTVTRVDLSKDLRHAKVFFSCLGSEEERKLSQEALDHSAAYVRGLVKKRFRLKIIPELVFRFDQGIERSIDMGIRLDRLSTPEEPPQEPRA